MDDEMAMMKKGSAKVARREPGPTSPRVEGAIAANIPPPEMPLDPGAAQAYVAALNDVFSALLPGEEIPPVAFKAAGPVDDFPDDVKARTQALSVFLKQTPAASKYSLDPAMVLASDEGLTEGTSQLVQLSGDQRTLTALQRTKPPSKPEGEKPAEFSNPVSDDDRKTTFQPPTSEGSQLGKDGPSEPSYEMDANEKKKKNRAAKFA
jgi:hypothetical protein